MHAVGCSGQRQSTKAQVGAETVQRSGWCGGEVGVARCSGPGQAHQRTPHLAAPLVLQGPSAGGGGDEQHVPVVTPENQRHADCRADQERGQRGQGALLSYRLAATPSRDTLPYSQQHGVLRARRHRL